jgi:hypothetical protein
MIGIEILEPKTVVDVSTLLTSTSIRGRNLHIKNHISSSFQVFNCSIIGSTKAVSSNQQCKLQTANGKISEFSTGIAKELQQTFLQQQQQEEQL